MSDLNSIERLKLERMFGMASGYVLDFSNRTFEEFFLENFKIEIYDVQYDYESGSKANRLRQFWRVSDNYLVGLVIQTLLEYWGTNKLLYFSEITPEEQRLLEECQRIAERLMLGGAAQYLDALDQNSDDRSIQLLESAIRDSVHNSEPEQALDRLHTYMVRFIRDILDKHDVNYDESETLNSLFVQYIRSLRRNGWIESDMTERILNSYIQILDYFNHVRNQRSLAHDNRLLNSRESHLVISGVLLVIKFLRSIEDERLDAEEALGVPASGVDDEIPF